MKVTLVHVDVKAEHVADFIKACRLNHLASVEEAGNRRFDILQPPTGCSLSWFVSQRLNHPKSRH